MKEDYQLKLNEYTLKLLPPIHATIACLSACPKPFLQAASKQHLKKHELKLLSTDNIITGQVCSWVKHLSLNLAKLRPTLRLQFAHQCRYFQD